MATPDPELRCTCRRACSSRAEAPVGRRNVAIYLVALIVLTMTVILAALAARAPRRRRPAAPVGVTPGEPPARRRAPAAPTRASARSRAAAGRHRPPTLRL